MRKVVFIIFLVGGLAGYLVSSTAHPRFQHLSPEEMYKRIIKERDFAIRKAVEAGVFRCCITPPCTMCYMEANQWNNYTAGTCACDNLITQGKEPCPQCKKGLCRGEDSTCNFKPTDIE